MSQTSPGLLHRLRHQYEPWALLHQAVTDRSGKDGQLEDVSLLKKINAYEPEFAKQNDQALQDLSERLRLMARGGIPFDDYLIEAFALVREASRRVLGLFHYDVQILGGLAICRGTIAEMATGEGKTLVQSLAAYTLSLVGRGVHVATANSYLAERDFEFAQPLYEFLGTSAALLPERVPVPKKRAAYQTEITYGTGTEFGFDYLRDQVELMGRPTPQLGDEFQREVLGRPAIHIPGCQRELAYAIIDESDSVLIDEAGTPLVISGKASEENPTEEVYELARTAALRLDDDTEKWIDTATNQASLTPEGKERIHSGEFSVEWAKLVRPWDRYVENALRAEYLLKRDIDYMINEEKKIVIVDSFTGRVREGSSWKEGLHQAVETAEGVPVSAETTSIAGISRQRFYTLYDQLSGMTGTASEAAGELWRFYRLPVTPVPRNCPSLAESLSSRIFISTSAKFEAIAIEAKKRQQNGQPVLIGCRKISESEDLSKIFERLNLAHTLLNAKTGNEEAELVARAGDAGAVTVATNMAGRGTHIALAKGVEERGGLHVIATGLEESSRIDRQLTGRSARQGQPGSHQFFLSAEDDLLLTHLPALAKRLSGARSNSDGEVKGGQWHSHFHKAQQIAEKENYRKRVATFRHDEWLTEIKNRLG